MKSIAIIPARGGSKRIPQKNVKEFYGKPVIAYTIERALKSGLFEDVIVSTDDSQIASIAREFGATCSYPRSAELADDYSSTVSVIQSEMWKLGSNFKSVENICCMYPATPLLQDQYLAEGLDLIGDNQWDYVFTAVEFKIPFLRNFQLSKTRDVSMFFPQFEHSRSQDLPISYQDAGQFYWGKREAWELGKPIFTSKSTIVQLPENEVIDIDTFEDWETAEKLFEARRRYF
jgi:pseudaminic acid cytidylyltransferase